MVYVVEQIAASIERAHVDARAGYLLAHAVHVDLDRVLAHFLVVGVKLLDEMLLADNAPETAQQHFEHAGFVRRQCEGGPVERRGSSDRVESETAVSEDQRNGTVTAAQQSAHPGLQLVQAERLHEIIVGAEVEARHFLLGLLARGKNEHGHVRISAPQPPQHFQPVELGKAEVEYHEAEDVVLEHRIGSGAICRPVDSVTGLAQGELQSLGDRGVVLRDQNAQPAPPPIFMTRSVARSF